MARFHYTAVNARGGEQKGALEAVDLAAAISALKVQGLFPLALADAAPGAPGPAGRVSAENRTALPPATPGAGESRLRLPFGRRAKSRDVVLFTRQLATLLRASMPLLRGLDVLRRQERNPGFATIIASVGEAIRSGGTLSDALASHRRIFDQLYLGMVKAGEAGGALDVVLERLARFQEKHQQLQGKIKSALAYPLAVMFVAVGILAALLVFVVPRFQQIFADLLKGAPLPPLTQAVITASTVAKHHFILVLVAGVVGWLAFAWFRRSKPGAAFLGRVVLRLPVFGDLVRRAIVARLTRTLGTLLAAGVPMLSALALTRETCGNPTIAGALGFVHDRVKEGEPVARSVETTRAFPPMVASMLEVGEQTGRLPEMLNQVADIYEAEVDNAVAGLSSLIEPLLIMFLAGVVGTIVIALFLPIVRIVQLLS
jgi:type IV pilus assembly protein PilC